MGDQVELLLRRLVEADPEEAVTLCTRLVKGVGEVLRALRAAAVTVDGAIDDH
ncbi:hypothetical protein SAV31267_023290 [Streptomyces avermitilis]|uniref:Uncharacterized protein n=1 Tax=Streptomyces avermitilis TaxID=33903 RepID=A0A4D4MMD1_STRAX|nr:hypothetical protein SAV31267_023290 [Streptomyces avermitilis]